MSNFKSLEVVHRNSETQPQVVENLNKLTYQDNALIDLELCLTAGTHNFKWVETTYICAI